jgi:Eco57I restriction-modification methylase
MAIALSKELRKLLENVTGDARILAEQACRAALENLAVHEREYRSHMSVDQRLLRNRLRARGRTLGDARDKRTGAQDVHHLTELAAYEHWHRLLFTRFLTENNLLITDEANGSVPVTLEDCEELAEELDARDGLDLACRFASRTLPGVFRRDDPVLDFPIAVNDQVDLRKLLAALPSEVFLADDALGWTYQFWQGQRKKEVNDSGKKIGADELSPVTQLFTEDYMVEFLLHNTLGAWWAGKLGPIEAASEQEARARTALAARESVPAISWTNLRFVQDQTAKTWLPAAGVFDSWPQSASSIRLLDPCMGSGHFLVFALPLLVRLRMEEENLGAQAAVVAVLKDNIHGLELDERCTQIAAFNVALTAWKLAGHQALPSLNIACSGLAPSATEVEWMALAGDNDRVRNGMARLHKLFKDAPILGSLINPRAQGGNLIEAEFHELAPLLTAVLASSENQKAKFENDAVELAVIAQGLAKAAELLAGQFTLVITNVPYLGRPEQIDTLKDYCHTHHKDGQGDLATCFIERCLKFCAAGAATGLVTPQSWLFQSGYESLRGALLRSTRWDFLARLGPRAFETISGERVNVCLLSLSKSKCGPNHQFGGFDVSQARNAEGKKTALVDCPVSSSNQLSQLKNPDVRITLDTPDSAALLSKHASCIQGLATSDDPQFTLCFWELLQLSNGWEGLMGTVEKTCLAGGRERVIHWEDGLGRYYRHALALKSEGRLGGWKSGTEARGKIGVLISQMSAMPVTLYTGDFYDHNASVIVPHLVHTLSAIWSFASSPDFAKHVRKLDSSLKPSNSVFVKVPFDLAHWSAVASEKYPDGLPKPHSDDPTQWLFSGHPAGSTQPLHVAVARLLGYRWPRQNGSSFPDCPALGPEGLESLADEDGIVCLPPLNREQPAAARLRQLLTAALGAFDERTLITAAGLKSSKSKNLEDWLRDEFFDQHAKLFHDRPFIWHVWDGRADGFHALVNYHRLDHANLQKLTYTYLGDWISNQRSDVRDDVAGAAQRLGAAEALQSKLAAILEGEAPLDIFVRWKSLKEQAVGWNPDLNDGVRQNIRPFLLAGDVGKRRAGVLRSVPLKLKDKDRGSEPNRPKEEYPWFWCEAEPGTDPPGGKDFVGNRWNNVHLTLERKRKAREK